MDKEMIDARLLQTAHREVRSPLVHRYRIWNVKTANVLQSLVQEEISAVFQKIANAKGTWNVTDYKDVSLFSDLVETNVITITIVQICSASHVLTKDASKYKALVKTCVHSEVQSACSSILNVETSNVQW